MKQFRKILLFVGLLNLVAIDTFAYTAYIDGIYYNFSGSSASVTNYYNPSYSGDVVIPSEVTYKDVTYTVTTIERGAFFSCKQLTSITMPNTIINIGMETFQNCIGLTSVTIPNSVRSIGHWAFSGCTNLTSVHITDLEAWCQISFGFSNANPLYYAHHLVLNDVEIKDLIIPSSLTIIGDRTFIGCSGLTSVTIGNNVTSIGEGAFQNCSNLNSITIPNNIVTLNKEAFSGCTNLTSAIIGTGVTSIGDNAFYKTNLKKTIWLTNTPPTGASNAMGVVNYVSNEQYNFYGRIVYPFLSSYFEVDGIRYVPVSPSERTCDAIDCVYNESAANTKIASMVSYKGIALTVKDIQPYVAYQNPYIISLEIDYDGEVPRYAFSNCVNMESVELGKKVISIGEFAFEKCSNLQSAKLESGTIFKRAFASCTNLKTVTIGDNISDIGEFAFYNCNSLETLIIPDATIASIGISAFQSCTSMVSATIGNGVSSIGNYAFSDCTGLTSTAIGNGVTSIGEYAFKDCSSLISANIGSGCESINSYAFSGCSSLNELIIGSQVKDIMNNAFENCSTLPTITIPKSVTTIGDFVFSGCSGLKNIIIADREEELALGADGSKPLFSSCPLDAVYIGGNISYKTGSNYGYSPFYRNISLQTIQITDKETEISENEFYGCSNLQTVRIGDGVTTIGNWAFSGCQSLKFFAFGTQVKTIGQEAFSDCTSVVEIISKAQTPPVCDSQALDDINKWECKLYVPEGCLATYETAEQWKDFFYKEEGTGSGGETPDDTTINGTCGETVNYSYDKSTHTLTITGTGEMTNYDYGSNEAPWFSYANEIQSIEIESGITSIGNFTFYKCSGITSLNIPATVTSIGSSAFEDCTGLTSLTLNEGLETVSGSAFEGCTGLKTLKIPSTVKTISINAFKNCTGITDVYCSAEDVPETDENAFDGTPTESAILHVPASSISAYIDAWPWSDFKAKIAIDATGDVDGNGKIDHDDLDDIVEHIMGRTPAGFKVEEADLNGDKKVNAVDVTIIINMIK